MPVPLLSFHPVISSVRPSSRVLEMPVQLLSVHSVISSVRPSSSARNARSITICSFSDLKCETEQ